MQNHQQQQDLKPIMAILWFAFLTSTIVFILVGYISVQKVKVPPATNETMNMVFLGLAVLMAVLSFQVPKFFRSQIRGRLKNETLTREQKTQMNFVPTLISFALSESVGVFGLLLMIYNGTLEAGLPLCLAATVLMAVHKPKDIS